MEACAAEVAEVAEAQGKASLTEVQSAYTSARSVTNMIIEQGRRVAKRKKSG